MDLPLLKQTRGYIAGQWRDADSGETLDVRNPVNGDVLGRVPNMGAAEANRALDAAAVAMRNDISIPTRQAMLQKIHDIVMANQDELGKLVTLENGKPLKEAKGEVAYAAGFFGHTAKQLGELLPLPVRDVMRGGEWMVHRRPAGVAALITPWNFPIAMMAKKLSAAIGAGCASVMKPANKTPLSLIAFVQLLDDVGLPAGYVNLLTGDSRAIGKAMCEHDAVRVVSFTGSTEVGRTLIEQSAGKVKKLSLELGGNAPFIVFDDADIDAAAEKLIPNKFRAAGQTCVCTNRVYVHASVEEKFVNAVIKQVAQLKVGDGMTDGVDLGPLIDRSAFDKVHEHVTDAIERGAQRVFGDDPPRPADEWGAFYPPVVLTGVQPDMTVCREETFGPVVAVSRFDDESDVIDKANATPYGLAAYVFTEDETRAQRVIAQLHFGHVGWNSGTGPTPEAPFGGMKQSGFGREGGIEGLLEFTEAQTVVRETS